MECEQAQDAISAGIDGEDLGIAFDAVERHVNGCDACSGWQATIVSLTDRFAALGEPGDTVLPAVLQVLRSGRAAQQDRQALRALRSWRAGLAVIAMVHFTLVVSSPMPGHAHQAGELGTWHLALAVGFFVAAVRPSRAWGMLPLVAALACGLVVTGGVGLLGGTTTVGGELVHAVDLLGLGCLWMVARALPSAPLTIRVARGGGFQW